MPLRTMYLHPRTRLSFSMSLRTSAGAPAKGHPLRGEEHQGSVALLRPLAGAGHGGLWGDEVRQSVFPAGKLGKLVVLRANSLRLTNSPEVLLSVTPYRRRSGLPRRFAPRNDRQKLAACPRLQLRATSQTRSRLRIRLKCCFSFCAAAGVTDCPVASLLAMTMGGRTCTRAHVFPSACHCEPVRTLVRQSASPQGNLANWHHFRQIRSTFPYLP